MSGAVTVGVDLGGTKMVAGLVAGDGTIAQTVIAERPRSNAAMMREPFALIESIITPETVGIGLGIAGLIDDSGRLAWGPNVSGVDLAFKAITEQRFGLPVAVDNDANCWALAEGAIGAAASYRHAVIVTLGTGIGGGIIVDRSIYRGNGFAGELGHMIVDPGGLPCTCGNYGCWETRVSGRRLDDLARRIAASDPQGLVAAFAGEELVQGIHLNAAALDGDGAAIGAFAEVGEWLGRGLALLAAVLDPEVFVVGGAVAEAGDLLLEPARVAFAQTLEGAEYRPVPPIVIRGLGAHGGAIGAGLAAHRLAAGE